MAAREDYFAYFGFGSLVNRNTLPTDHVRAIPATLKGWRRHWQARPIGPDTPKQFHDIALLSIHRDGESQINGLLIIDRVENLADLEKREHAYHKVSLGIDDFDISDLDVADLDIADLDISDLAIDNNEVEALSELLIHTHISPNLANGRKQLSILRSYLDVVMQGYYREYGEAGLGRFMASTKGFELSVTEDRATPFYSRHQPISPRESAIFEQYLPGTGQVLAR